MKKEFNKKSEVMQAILAAVIIIAFFVVCNIFSSCSPRIYPPASSEHSTDTVIRERVIRDSVYFQVPVEVEKNVTRDTLSHLENTYAESDAVVCGGLLHHTLASKPQKIYVPYTVVEHDTTIVTKDAETIIKEVPAQLSNWQSFCLVLGKIALSVVVVLTLCVVAYFVIKTKLRR